MPWSTLEVPKTDWRGMANERLAALIHVAGLEGVRPTGEWPSSGSRRPCREACRPPPRPLMGDKLWAIFSFVVTAKSRAR